MFCFIKKENLSCLRLCCRNYKDEYISQNGYVRGLLVSTASNAREESSLEKA